MRVAAVVPAYQAETTIERVVTELALEWRTLGERGAKVIVVDDGSNDRTAERARRAGADVMRHDRNRGKGAALRTGFERARVLGAGAVVSVDADGQHPASQAALLARAARPGAHRPLRALDSRDHSAARELAVSREQVSLAKRHRRKLMFIATVLLLPLLAHLAVIVSARPTSPRVELPGYHLERPSEG